MIVARGLGRGAGRILVTAGLGLALAVTPPEPPISGGGGGFASFAVPSAWLQPTKPRQLELELRLAIAGHATSITTLSGDLAPRDVPQTPAAVDQQPEPTDRTGTQAGIGGQRPADPPAASVTITGPIASAEQAAAVAPQRASAHATGSTYLRADLALRLPVRLAATLATGTSATASLQWRAQQLQGAHSSRSDLRASLTIRHPETAPLTAILAALDAVDAQPKTKRIDPMQALLAALDALDAADS